jgi:hypothetical protein
VFASKVISRDPSRGETIGGDSKPLKWATDFAPEGAGQVLGAQDRIETLDGIQGDQRTNNPKPRAFTGHGSRLRGHSHVHQNPIPIPIQLDFFDGANFNTMILQPIFWFETVAIAEVDRY